MSGYGPLRDAPNPLQGLAARSVAAGAVLWGVLMTPLFTAMLLLWDTSIRWRSYAGGAIVAAAILMVYVLERLRGVTPQARGDTIVRYLPWFGRRTDPPADVLPPAPIRPFTRMLARATLVRSVLRGAVLGAAATAPWVPHLWIAGVASAAGGVLAGLAHRRYRTNRHASKR